VDLNSVGVSIQETPARQKRGAWPWRPCCAGADYAPSPAGGDRGSEIAGAIPRSLSMPAPDRPPKRGTSAMFSTVNSLAATSISPVAIRDCACPPGAGDLAGDTDHAFTAQGGGASNSSFGRSDDRKLSASGLRVANVIKISPRGRGGGPSRLKSQFGPGAPGELIAMMRAFHGSPKF